MDAALNNYSTLALAKSLYELKSFTQLLSEHHSSRGPTPAAVPWPASQSGCSIKRTGPQTHGLAPLLAGKQFRSPQIRTFPPAMNLPSPRSLIPRLTEVFSFYNQSFQPAFRRAIRHNLRNTEIVSFYSTFQRCNVKLRCI